MLNSPAALHINTLTLSVNGEALLGPLTFDVNAGEILTLMGASGCGKSSLLAAIAGHLPPSFQVNGECWLGNNNLLLQTAQQRRIGLLFQDDLLFPHLTVEENLLFALPAETPNRKQKVRQSLEKISMHELISRYPHALSGGQKARIGLLRTLLSVPKALALDEPFAKLDKPLRRDFKAWAFKHIQEANIPALLVTHDEEDAPIGGKILRLT